MDHLLHLNQGSLVFLGLDIHAKALHVTSSLHTLRSLRSLRSLRLVRLVCSLRG